MADEQTQPQAEQAEPWVYLRHPDISGDPHRVPNDPTVVELYEARGWERTDAPAESSWVVPDPGPQLPPDAVDDGWVELEHPELDGRRHRFPADPAAVEAAQEAGWRVPEPPAEEAAEEPDEPPVKAKKTPKKSAEPAADSTEE